MKLEQGETVLLRKAANIRKRLEYAGGFLTLTNRRLLIEPHKVNLDSRAADIPLASIASIEPFNVFWIMPTGVVIKLKDGGNQRLVVWGRGAVIAAIRQAAEISGRTNALRGR